MFRRSSSKTWARCTFWWCRPRCRRIPRPRDFRSGRAPDPGVRRQAAGQGLARGHPKRTDRSAGNPRAGKSACSFAACAFRAAGGAGGGVREDRTPADLRSKPPARVWPVDQPIDPDVPSGEVMASENVSARTSFFFDRSAIVAVVGKAAAAVLAKGGLPGHEGGPVEHAEGEGAVEARKTSARPPWRPEAAAVLLLRSCDAVGRGRPDALQWSGPGAAHPRTRWTIGQAPEQAAPHATHRRRRRDPHRWPTMRFDEEREELEEPHGAGDLRQAPHRGRRAARANQLNAETVRARHDRPG